MAESLTQSYSNHTRWDPLFHFVLMPIAFINLIVVIVHVYKSPSLMSAWILVLAVGAVLTLFKMRLYSLKVQNRVIRLEERLRLATLLPEHLRSRMMELSERQLVGLRFAADAEVPALVERCCNEKLSTADIKKGIKEWRADYYRV